MRNKLTSSLTRARDTFGEFTTGQKAVALVGTGALLIAAFLVFRWVSTPSYAPLYSGLSGEDAAAVIEELQAEGIPYEVTGGGGTVMVPSADVYTTRITLSGQGLPGSSEEGYSVLDGQDLSTSEFKEQTDYKRAMEGELSKTIEAIEGVETAVVHLALPEKEVFTEEQTPATASVLVDLSPGDSLDDEQVDAIVHLVASSIESLDPKQVTVADSTGLVLTDGDEANGSANTRAKAVEAYQDSVTAKIQAQLDRILGVGNSSVMVTADLDFDQSVTETNEYIRPEDEAPPLSSSETTETYNGDPNAVDGGAGGVVGADGEMDDGAGTGGATGSYNNSSRTVDNAYGTRSERREAAPGTVEQLNVSAAVDATAASAAGVQPQALEELIASGVGIQPRRGDAIEVNLLPFDRTAEDAAAKELADAAAADAKAEQMAMLRNIGIAGFIALAVLLAWLQARRRRLAREEATSYIVEQLRSDQAARPVEPAAPAVAALEVAEQSEEDRVRDELIALVDKQPEDVAALLRGWLVEPR